MASAPELSGDPAFLQGSGDAGLFKPACLSQVIKKHQLPFLQKRGFLQKTSYAQPPNGFLGCPVLN